MTAMRNASQNAGEAIEDLRRDPRAPGGDTQEIMEVVAGAERYVMSAGQRRLRRW